MDREEIRKSVTRLVVRKMMAEFGQAYVPVAVSNRHVHLSRKDIDLLFGEGYELQPIRELSQPRQFVCAEKVKLIGTKGTMEGIRVLGPDRVQTQVEISVSDGYALGIKPPVRMSGDLKGSAGGWLDGPKGRVHLEEGVIVSARHLHLSEEEAQWFGLKDGDRVELDKGGMRPMVLGDVVVRTGPAHRMEVHIDTDEANAAAISNGEVLQMKREAGRRVT